MSEKISKECETCDFTKYLKEKLQKLRDFSYKEGKENKELRDRVKLLEKANIDTMKLIMTHNMECKNIINPFD